MALAPVDEAHALQIQAGALGRKAGHAFEDKLTQKINSFAYPLKPHTVGSAHLFTGDPATLLLSFVGAKDGITRIVKAVALSTGALATSEEGKKWLSVNGASISRCKSDLIITLETDDGRNLTIGVSTKQCNNKSPTNAQMYFTTARGFASLLQSNSICVSDAAITALRQFCGEAGFRPFDDSSAMNPDFPDAVVLDGMIRAGTPVF